MLNQNLKEIIFKKTFHFWITVDTVFFFTFSLLHLNLSASRHTSRKASWEDGQGIGGTFFSIKTYIFILTCLKFQEDNSQDNIQMNNSQSKAKIQEDVLIYINITFTILFSIECFLKLLAFGIKVCQR